jgi:hypothetical protein
VRILCTGSREFTDAPRIYMALSAFAPARRMTVIHGGARGADSIVHDWCEIRTDRIDEEIHLADWNRECTEKCFHAPRSKNGKRYCPVAGNLRNQEMVDSGADICLAFFMRGAGNRGTDDCVRKAMRAGIKVETFWQEY